MYMGTRKQGKKGHLTASELAEKYGITPHAVIKKMARHGFKYDAQKRYKESDFLAAQASGAQADKSTAAKQLADLDAEGAGETLQAQLLRRKIKLLDVDILTAQAKLDELRGRYVSVDEHLEKLTGVVAQIRVFWDKAAEAVATKRKDPELLRQLRQARDLAMQEIRDGIH
jgi:DNA-binding MarR family transcriptional regulator